jgi:putative hydrolase of the HAD superfamily
MSATQKFQAVIWDFGGVLTTSPFDAFARYERDHGLPLGFIRSVNARNPNTNAWALFEQAQISAEAFDAAFLSESAQMGHGVAGRDVLALLSGDLRAGAIEALKVISQDYKVGCVTNNVPMGQGPGMAGTQQKALAVSEVMALFDHVIESSKIGIRKPDPRIYRLMCEALAVDPLACVYLDDLGINLKPARDMGMTTVKVVSEGQLLADLSALLDLDLLGLTTKIDGV